MINSLSKVIRLLDITKSYVDDVTYVSKKGRDEFVLTEHGRSMIIYAELLTDDPRRAIDFGSISKWLPPHDHEILKHEDRERVLRKFIQHLKMRRESYTVISDLSNGKQHSLT